MDLLTIKSKNKWTKANNNKETSYSNKFTENMLTILREKTVITIPPFVEGWILN